MAYGTLRLNIPLVGRINPIPRTDIISVRPILILSSHLRIGLPKDLFFKGLPIKIFKALLPFPF